ncbi:hypothetical protein [Hymenobacter sp. YC55]|uniref:hypothetical protein n=1 Tax=Hymenobacter sp. YC55 TaxID=3034019 RepID=UPI0023F6D486|nr:hypothetical protein [Hymenobacter sp. YC55]MDF7813756.1 hypothetical protein [Hymenobacter sp. YC55]
MTAIELEIERAALAYHAQRTAIELTATDYAEWLLTLPPGQHNYYAQQGFEACCAVAAFQRYCLEWRGFSMRDYFVKCLSYEAFRFWSTRP